MDKFDLIVIGAGAVGSAVAYEGAKNGLSVCVIEREPDVCFETSARNSGVVHSGFNNPTGSLKALYCKRGSDMFEGLATEIDVPYRKTGKYVVAISDEDKIYVDELYEQGRANGVNVETCEFQGRYALYSPDTAITDPLRYTIALAEAAHLNGAIFHFDRNVKIIEKNSDSLFELTTTQKGDYGEKEQIFTSRYVVNAAGLGAADVCRIAGIDKFEVLPCRGEYHIVDPYFGEIDYPVYPAVRPGADVLGVHLTPTIDGNILIGPSSEYLQVSKDMMLPELYATTGEVMDQLFEEGSRLLPGLTKAAIIRSFAGVRPKVLVDGDEYDDFLIDESIEGFISLLGIESPGITASMPLAMEVVDKIISYAPELSAKKVALGTFPYNRVSGAAQQICRCESVTANDVLMAFDRLTSLGARPTLRGLKNRTRIGMGRCQGSFCTGELITLLRQERQIDPMKFSMAGAGSEMFTRRLR